MTDDILDPGPYLITSTGGRIYRHKDDPPGHYKIPGGEKVVRWSGTNASGEIVHWRSTTEGILQLDVEED